jgi:hypothetical protein
MHKNCTIYFSVTCSFIGDRWFVNRIHLSGLRVEALEISFIGDRWFVNRIHLSGLRVEALEIKYLYYGCVAWGIILQVLVLDLWDGLSVARS